MPELGSFAAGYLLMPLDDEVEGDLAALRAASLSPDASTVLGDASTVLQGVYGVLFSGDSWHTVAGNGTLAYVPGTVADRQLVWVDAEGDMQPASDVPAVYEQVDLSPDGRYAVVKSVFDLWVYDLEGGTRSRLTAAGALPVWDRDGKRVFFSSNRSGDWDVWVRSADGTGAAEHVWERELSQWVTSVAPDGTLLMTEPHPETARDLWVIPPGGDPRPFLVTPANEDVGAFSPDGSLVAYATDEGGRDEIYVVPYPGPGPRVPISREGGWAPRWSRDGKTILYLQATV